MSKENPAPVDPSGDFDPSAEVPDAVGGEGLEGIAPSTGGDGESVQVGRALSAEELEMKRTAFGNSGIRDFTAFGSADEAKTEGVFRFDIDRMDLQRAVNAVKPTAMGSRSAAAGVVRITLFADKVRMATFNHSAFAEYFIPARGPVVGVADVMKADTPLPALVFDLSILEGIARHFPSGVLTCEFDAKKLTLRIMSGQTNLQLSTLPVSDFTDYHRHLGEPEYKAQVNPVVLKDALEYTSLFMDRGDMSVPAHSVTTIRDSKAIAGSAASIGHYQREEFSGLKLTLKNDQLRALMTVLVRMNPANTHLFAANNFCIIRDENVYLGLEMPDVEFPPTEKILAIPDHQTVIVPRSAIESALAKLSVVAMSTDLLVLLRFEGTGNEATMRMETRDLSGKVSSDECSCYRVIAKDAPDELQEGSFALAVKISTLRRIVTFFETSNVEIKIPENQKSLVLSDSPADGAETISILIAETKESIDADRAKREKARTKNAAS